MLLLEPQPTAFDLRWRMFGIDVRVHPTFWLITALLGWGWFDLGRDGSQGLAFVGLWVLCVFLSILVHELGHVVAGRIFGTFGHIVLYSFGGLAVNASNLAKRWQRIIVYLAGPGAQFLLLGVVWLIRTPVLDSLQGSAFRFPSAVILSMLWIINLYWPILNLLPILPLDGGQVCREICEGVWPRNGRRYALVISMVVAITLVVQFLTSQNGNPGVLPWIGAWVTGGPLTALFFALFAFQNYQMLQEESSRRRNWDDDRLPWER